MSRSTSWQTLYRYKRYYAKGFIEPAHSAVEPNKVAILVYKRGSDGAYRYNRSFTASYSYYSTAKSRYTAAVKFTAKGTYKLVARHYKDSKNDTSYGSADYVTVK